MSKRKQPKVPEPHVPSRRVTPSMTSAKRSNVDSSHSKLEDAKIVVGLDFGTTFSGFAYALMAQPDKVFTFYDWPSEAAAGAKPYCKTQTSLWYLPGRLNGTFEVQDWGWRAFVNHSKAVQAKNSYMKSTTARTDPRLSTCGHFSTKMKLHLTPAGSDSISETMRESLPDGMSAERVISDYLKLLSTFIMAELKNKFGSYILKRDVQWCLTVPAIWDDAAKQTMLDCSQMAGLVQGRRCRDMDASLHPIIIVLEPEAASVYCQQILKSTHFKKGSKFLVVDAGGGTVDLVVHEKVDDSGVRVKEVACSTGGLCGGTFVDKDFMNYLAQKIDCFENFSVEYPATVLTLRGNWENFKCSFDGQQNIGYDLEMPAKLADAWEAHQKSNGTWKLGNQYDELVISGEDIKGIFDGVVNTILNLVKDQLIQVPDVEAIMVVGGFSNSPYLMKRIRDKFSRSVKHIVSPTEPGSAVCRGAVAFGVLGADILLSRKSRKTYGVNTARPFMPGDPVSSLIYDDDMKALCKNTFCVFTRIGDDVPVDHSVPHEFVPVKRDAKSIFFTMYATSDPEPAYVTDTGVEKVGSWTFPIPLEAQSREEKLKVQVTMFFGRTRIEVVAQPQNFTGEETSVLSLLFERDLF